MLANTRILNRLVLLVSFLMAMLIIVGGMGFYATSRVREELRTVYEDRMVCLGQLDRIDAEYHRIRRELLFAVMMRDPAIVAQTRESIARRDAVIKENWKAYLKTRMTPEEKKLVAATGEAMNNFDAKQGQILARLAVGGWDGAIRLRTAGETKAFDNFSENLDKLSQLQIDIAALQYTNARAEAATFRSILIWMTIAALAGGIALAWVISRSITRPLEQIIRAMQKLTGGDFKVEVMGQKRRDEVGELSRAVVIFKNSMIEAETLRSRAEETRFFATLNAVVEALPATVAVIDTKADIIFVDRKWRKLAAELGDGIGRAGDNYLGQMDQFIKGDPQTVLALRESAEDVLGGRLDISTVECDFVTPSVRRRYLVTVTPLPVREGGAVVMCSDITERAERETELRIRNKAMNEALTPITIADANGNFTFVNRAFLDVWGFEDDSAVIGTIGDSLWAENVEFKKKIVSFFENGVLECEMTAKRLDGNLRHLWVTASLVRNSDGSPLSIISSYLDLTERIAMEKALRESEQYNRTLFETSSTGLVLSRADGTYLDVNSAFARILGLSVDDVRGINYRDITPVEYMEKQEEAMKGMMENGHYGPFEKEFLRQDGSRVPVRIYGSRIKISGKTCIWSSVEDITEQRKIDEQIRQSLKLQSIGTLAGGISHEINNLLMPIVGLAELVRDNTKDEQNISNLNDILITAERARRLVAGILAFSRRKAVIRQTISLAPTIEKILELMRFTIPSNVRITLDIEPDLLVDADESQIQQVAMNLIANAVQAMGLKGGLLDINASQYIPEPLFFEKYSKLAPGDYVKIMISDTGHGMDEQTLSRIFEPFFTTKEVGEGTGMGLPVVHGIIESHGGVIEVESQIDIETCVKIYLPAA
jgi:PAS domain S-box-containing protein